MIHSSWISLSLIGFRALCLYYPVICQSVHSSVAWDLSTLHDKQLFCIIVKCRHPSESTRERALKGCLHAYRCLWPCTLCSKYTWTGMITWPWCLQLSTSVSAAELALNPTSKAWFRILRVEPTMQSVRVAVGSVCLCTVCLCCSAVSPSKHQQAGGISLRKLIFSLPVNAKPGGRRSSAVLNRPRWSDAQFHFCAVPVL